MKVGYRYARVCCMLVRHLGVFWMVILLAFLSTGLPSYLEYEPSVEDQPHYSSS